jgi:uncharacterized membrane protein YhhN
MSGATLALVVLLGLGHIVARTLGRTGLAGALKALPVALLAAVTLGGEGGGDESYRRLVGAALVASMAGDLLLLSPRAFVPGLASFLVAHVIYVAAFAPAANVDGSALALLVPFVGFAALVLRHLWFHLGRHRAPVAVYVAVITTMGWLATLRALGGEVAPRDGVLAAAGAYAFMTSDTTLAVNRFARPLWGGQIVIMGTYYLAQTLLALSAVS